MNEYFEPQKMTMMQRSNLNHFSPIFANKHWTTEEQQQHYACYERTYDGSIRKAPKGKGLAQWGRERKLYSQALEKQLNTELENAAALLYNKLINAEFLNADERMKWSQFLITQSVRTPSFLAMQKRQGSLAETARHGKIRL